VYAVKIIDKSSLKGSNEEMERKLGLLTNELLAMDMVNSKYIIKIHEFIKEEKFYNIIIELANGCALIELLNKRSFTEAEVNLMIKQLVAGCYVLFQKNIVHRDLNIKNVLIHFP
jgi:serine/threonine protein kinase